MNLRVSAFMAAALSLAFLAACSVSHNRSETGETVTIRTPAGGINVNDSVDPKAIGLAVYPGSRPHHDNDKDSGSVNMEMFGMKLVVASFESDDPPAKVADYYSKEVRKFGNVLQCKSEGVTFNPHSRNEWGCEHGETTDVAAAASGGGLELKAGDKGNMHIVAVKPHGGGTEYALVYVRTGKGESL
ncbi:MAG: hypothetical protein JO041_02730 [Acidobacteria bacterium]|nr:hypothetical protein [Acidobacteriota bacterium]